MSHDTLTLDLDRWMVKQLRGMARESKHDAKTAEGESDSEQIEEVLSHYLEEESVVGFSQYTALTDETAIYPSEFPDFVTPELVYVALGLGEVGEIQGKIKKAIREDDPEYLNEAVDEAGDLLWYAARLPHELSKIDEVDFHGDLGDIAEGNIDKLFDRKERDTLTGSGDNR